eukprot:scaffold5890_cov110-Isochrysis_galbana.AAC.6
MVCPVCPIGTSAADRAARNVPLAAAAVGLGVPARVAPLREGSDHGAEPPARLALLHFGRGLLP